MNTAETRTENFLNLKDGDTFEVAGIEFIKFPDKDGMTPVVAKNILFNSRFGDNNDLRASEVMKRLKEEILPKICMIVGEENVCTFPTDLTTWDGLKPYGVMEEKISLPTMDFYRENVDIFDKHPASNWWWLATPETAQPHAAPNWILCVSPSGHINGVGYIYIDVGVRPILYFKSSIFGSSEA
ncbi:MAG: hypothetical protein J6Q30_00800 [Oscillospiraceae bacterium]|nr:hypothetical protein [Oscillospiraceae bacterium]